MRITDIIELAWGTLCPAVFLVMLSYLVGLFVFGPIHARAIWKPPQTSFRIADIILLLAQLQLVGGLLFAILPEYYRGPDLGRIGIAVVCWILQTFWWWTGVRLLAKAKVENTPHRLWFLGVFVPLGYLATIGILLMPVTVIVAFAMVLTMVSVWAFHGPDVLALFGLLVFNAATIGAVVATRLFCSRIVGRAKDDVAVRDGVAMGPLVEGSKPIFLREHAPMASDQEVKFFEDPPAQAKPVV
jgi:hypothetical protein